MRTTRFLFTLLLVTSAVVCLAPVSQGAEAKAGTTAYYIEDGSPALFYWDNHANLGRHWERMGSTSPSGNCKVTVICKDSTRYAVSDSMTTDCFQYYKYWAEIWLKNNVPGESNTVTVELRRGTWGSEGTLVSSDNATVNSTSWTKKTFDFGAHWVKMTNECYVLKIKSSAACAKVSMQWDGANCPSALYRTRPSVRIPEIQDGTILAGERVTVENVMVTAGPYEYTTTGAYCFVGELCLAPYSGIEVYWSSAQAPIYGDLERGDMVTITGIVQEYYDMTEIDISHPGDTLIVVSTGNPVPEPNVVPLAELMDEQWEGVLVSTNCSEVTNPDLGYGEYEITDSSGVGIVDDQGIEVTYIPTMGDQREFTGILAEAYGTYRLWPRDNDDIKVCAVAPPAAWITTPIWRMQLTSFGYSDIFWEHKPHWLRYWPYTYAWFWDEVLSGEWVAAVYYDEIPSPAIDSGPNAGAPQVMWLEPNFIYPNWTTNSNFWVVTPITTWNRGELPLPYMDTGFSSISNGQVQIDIDYLVHDDWTAMGRCGTWFWPWRNYVWSDRYILQQIYTIKNIADSTLNDLEFFQFLHGHPGTHEMFGWWGDWEVYDPVQHTWPAFDTWGNYHYDITQWGRKYLYTWPWPYLYGWWWGYDYVGFHSQTAPSAGRSPWPWGLGDYSGHAPGKPAAPGVHWDVERDNLDPVPPQPSGPGTPCVLYPTTYPIYGRQVAGAETWLLAPELAPADSVVHDVLLSIANRPFHGWHWGYSWWYWHDWTWPYWPYPSIWFSRWHNPHYPFPYRLWIDYPWWWHCYYWPRPHPWPVWFGIALPSLPAKQGVLTVENVYFKEYAPEGGGDTLATFQYAGSGTAADTELEIPAGIQPFFASCARAENLYYNGDGVDLHIQFIAGGEDLTL